MKSNEITDLIVGYFLLFLMIGVVAIGFDPLSYKYSNRDVKFPDEERLFLLNYLRTDAGGERIADMIALSENRDKFLLRDLRSASRQILNFYGFNGRNYLLEVRYPDGEAEYITSTKGWDLIDTGEEAEGGVKTGLKLFRSELCRGERIMIPSINGGLITVELVVEDE